MNDSRRHDDVLGAILETAEGLFKIGLIDETTFQDFVATCSAERQELIDQPNESLPPRVEPSDHTVETTGRVTRPSEKA